jgi:protein SCO1/2
MSASRLFPALLLGAVLLIGGCKKNDAAFEMLQVPGTPAPLARHWPLPDFSLTERSGQPLRLADLAGKVWVADFFYTTCPGPCPMLSSRLSDVQKALGEEPGARLVSISVDPEKDTPDVLKIYAERFKASERWFFCTGPKDAIYSLARDGFKLPIADAPAEGGMIAHSTRLVLVDQTGHVRGFYEGGTESSVGELVRDIRRLLEEK